MNLNRIPEAEARAVVDAYLDNKSSDSRRLVWLVENAMEGVADKIRECETRIVVDRVLERAGDTDQDLADLKSLEEDFRFLCALCSLVNSSHVRKESKSYVISLFSKIFDFCEIRD